MMNLLAAEAEIKFPPELLIFPFYPKVTERLFAFEEFDC